MYLRLLSGKAKKIEKKIKKSSRDLVRALLKPTCKEQKLEKEARNFPSSYKSIKKKVIRRIWSAILAKSRCVPKIGFRGTEKIGKSSRDLVRPLHNPTCRGTAGNPGRGGGGGVDNSLANSSNSKNPISKA